MNEEWRVIKGTDGMYEVSSLGRVRSMDRVLVKADGTRQPWKGSLLAQSIAGRGYPSVMLRFGLRRNVHVLVCEAFHGPKPTPTHQAAHENGRPTDNRAVNLAWKTPSENQRDSIRHGTKYRHPDGNVAGENNWNARLTWAIVEQIRSLRQSGITLCALAAQFGVSKSQIHNIVTGQEWKP